MTTEEKTISYQRAYRRRHRDEINLRQRRWRAENPEKTRAYRKKYLQKLEMSGRRNIRASWAAYGISKARYKQLTEYIRSGRYATVVRQAAHAANKDYAEYLLLSVTGKLSYDGLEKLWARGDIERMPCGRSDFYGWRRLFYHYLDVVLKELEKKEQKGEEE